MVLAIDWRHLMLTKLRYKLTLICALITTTVLTLTVIITFLISQSQFNTRTRLSLNAQLNTLVYYLQNAYSYTSNVSSISHHWLSQLEVNNQIIIHIENNHIPLLFEGSYLKGSQRQALIASAKKQAEEQLNFNFYLYTNHDPSLHADFFELKSSAEGHYQVAVSSFSVKTTNYQVILLQDMAATDTYIHRQLLLYIIFALLGIMVLTLFSFWFAGHAILPIAVATRRQKEFIAAASHELRSPLAVVQTNSSALATQYPEITQSPFFTSITNEARRMTKLVNDLLLLSRADANTKWTLDLQAVEIDTLLLEVYDIFYPRAKKSGHHLLLDLPQEAAAPCLLDAERLLQVFTILLDNALSYTPTGSDITLKLTYLPREFCIQVIDNGLGISDEHKSHIYERFYRIDPSRHHKEHTGLGLSIAQEIITLHHGSLALTDTLPHGCTFTIKIPIQLA